MSFLYNLLLFLYLIFLFPKLLMDHFFFNKKRKDLLYKLGIKKYHFENNKNQDVIWLHAVSVGETKASITFLNLLKRKYPNSYIIISNTTDTGHVEAKKSLLADKHIYMPFDFSFTQKYYLKKLKPKLIIFIETDIWYNFLKYSKKYNSKIYLVSAKISKRSANRYSKIPFFSKKLFSYFDNILCQNEEYLNRFILANAKKDILKVTGNIKFDNKPQMLTLENKQNLLQKLKLQDRKVLTIASTHYPEEKLILDQLENVFEKISNLKIILAPRHINRINEIESLLIQKKISYIYLSNIDKQNGNEKIILVDSMGNLNDIYQVSDLAIVAGSYIQRVGGHNILEPIVLNTFAFFGPFMHTQKDLKDIALKYKCAQMVDIDNLLIEVLNFFNINNHKISFDQNIKSLNLNLQGSSNQSISYIY
ncbi:MAG: 3-deoxy-D-manno-octulosonic acid transferase [Candidatus Anoxychlamydiales bacterium]|nr:3-deoxy-D-manno-octulosonic acid transferase [Candidatus Anoxychlamydiales bacterium]